MGAAHATKSKAEAAAADASKAAAAAKALAAQVSKVTTLDRKKLSKAVVSAAAQKAKALSHFKAAESEKKFALSVASSHLQGASARNVEGAAVSAAKQAAGLLAAANAKLQKARAIKKRADTELVKGRNALKKADAVSARKAAKAAALGRKAIAVMKDAKKANRVAHTDAVMAATASKHA